MTELEVDSGGLTRTLKDLFAGAAGGVAQVLLGQSHHFHASDSMLVYLLFVEDQIQDLSANMKS